VATDVTRLLDGVTPGLMVTDPPYGVEYDAAWRAALQPQARTAVGRVANDDRVDWSAAYALFPGPIAYVWHAGIHTEAAAASLRQCTFVIRSQIIWVKQHFALSRGHYHWQHEPCYYAVRDGHAATWRGSRTQTTVWQVPNLNPLGGERGGENTVTGHSTQKPVRLFEIPILNHTRRGDAVYEPFCGSGTALIAAEKTGRRCLAMELEPRYVQAAITRWEAYTGQCARVITTGGGQ
jgi:DNA modification methylase